MDLDRDNQLDANEQAALFSQTNDDGWAITKSAGGKPQLAMRKMDTNDDGGFTRCLLYYGLTSAWLRRSTLSNLLATSEIHFGPGSRG